MPCGGHGARAPTLDSGSMECNKPRQELSPDRTPMNRIVPTGTCLAHGARQLGRLLMLGAESGARAFPGRMECATTASSMVAAMASCCYLFSDIC